MSKYAIEVKGLGKEYIIGGAEQRHDSFREMLTGALVAPFKKIRKLGGIASEAERFWALKNLSFNVEKGEVLGIIGRNGAGKSTLLKVLSRITSPTEGMALTRGRVASLLEVGTGFHPELTGRENIFLNGTILGMPSAEIHQKFDKIVAFAEIDEFIDTPVKRYSSGMSVRLAFSVAAHLEPEILIVDEVLAVGDLDFQKKCLGKLESVSSEGRTVLFVSHNLSAIRSLCNRCILLNKGQMVSDGACFDVLKEYTSETRSHSDWHRSGKPEIAKRAWIESVRMDSKSANSEQLVLKISVSVRFKLSASLDFRIKDNEGGGLGFCSIGGLDSSQKIKLVPGVSEVSASIPTNALASGSYLISIDLVDPNVEYFDRIEDCLEFEIHRKATETGSREIEQRWGFGSIRFDVRLLSLEKPSIETIN